MKTRFDYLGLSTDDKPTNEAVNGSTFKEVDTSKLYIFYEGEWYEKVTSGGGSSEYNIKAIAMPVGKTMIKDSIEEVKDLDVSNITSMNNCFNSCSSLKKVSVINMTNITILSGTFLACSLLTDISLDDTSKVTTTKSMFGNCESLVSVPLFDTGNVTNMNGMFNGCINLEEIPLFDTKKVEDFGTSGMASMFYNCSKLSNNSLNNIMKMCINATAYTGTKTLATLGITSGQATTCQGLSNYEDFIASGWTTGY